MGNKKKKTKTTKRQREREILRRKERRLKDSPRKISQFWMNCLQPATRCGGSIPSRICWGGVPCLDAGDPLYLCGMELLLVWYPSQTDKERYTNGEPVSSFTIDEFMGTFQTPHGYSLYEYEVTVLQLVTPDSEYGQLLAKQKKRGQLADDEDVIHRQLRMLFPIGPPTVQDRKLLRDLDIEPLDHILRTAIQPYRRRTSEQALLPGQPDEEGLATEMLSDLEVDRLWELTAAVSAWMYAPQKNAEARYTQKAALTRRSEALVEKCAQLEAELKAVEQKLEVLAHELEEVSARVARHNESYETQKKRLDVELVRARAASTRAESEVSRLHGVFRQRCELVTAAVRLHGAHSKECAEAQRHAELASAQYNTAVSTQEKAAATFEQLQACYDQRVQTLKRKFWSDRAAPMSSHSSMERLYDEFRLTLEEVSASRQEAAAELANVQARLQLYSSL